MIKNIAVFMIGFFLLSVPVVVLAEETPTASGDTQVVAAVPEKFPRVIPLPLTDLLVPQIIDYQIEYGDTLGNIARKFGTTVESITKINHLTTHAIYAGQKIRVWHESLTISIDKSDNILIVKSGDQVIKQYQVATGAANITPVGEFTISSRIDHPTWFKKGEVILPDSPENALGTRWLGFDKPQYGIHGTLHPELIGQQVSHGCVRMRNEDVEELFDYIALGTKVNIQD